jgi:hypothetical protein
MDPAFQYGALILIRLLLLIAGGFRPDPRPACAAAAVDWRLLRVDLPFVVQHSGILPVDGSSHFAEHHR